MTRSLLARWCPEPHEAPITAAVYDPHSASLATLDASGLLAVSPGGATSPAWTFSLPEAAAPRGEPLAGRALAVSRGGARVALGDDDGRLFVLAVADGGVLYVDERPGDAGPHRAVRALAFSPDGNQLATLAADGRIRITDVVRGQRLATFSDFGGDVLLWDASGTRLVAADRHGQPTLVHLTAKERTSFPLIPGGLIAAAFVPDGRRDDGRRVVVMGGSGVHLVDTDQMGIIAAKSAAGRSSMVGMALAPDGRHVAVVSARSIHYFQVEGLRNTGKEAHVAADPTGAVVWDAAGVAIADGTGRLLRSADGEPLPGVVCVAGKSGHRAIGHDHQVAFWRDHARVSLAQLRGRRDGGSPELLKRGEGAVEVAIDPEGRVLAALPEGLPLHVYDARKGHLLFAAGPDTVDAPRVDVGLGVVAALLEPGGMRWFDLRNNRVFELDWARDFAVTGGGTWLAVVTPRGRVRVLDPTTGDDALPALGATGDAPVRLVSFVFRRPELLVLDEEGVLVLVDLEPLARDGAEAVVHRIGVLRGGEIDALWGLADGKRAVARVQHEDETATFLTVDLDTGELLHEVSGMLPYASVDPDTGHLLEPAAGNAVLERELDGTEHIVLRALPRGEWMSFDANGVLHESAHAAAWRGEAPRAAGR